MMQPKTWIKPQDKTWIELSHRAVRANLKILRRKSGSAEVMTVIKANAYGHGLIEIASILNQEKVHWFGVDSVEEGMALRGAGFKQKILILGFVPTHRVRDAVENKLSFVAYDVRIVKEAARWATKKRPAFLHLKIETGLYRQGLTPEEAAKLARLTQRHQYLIVEGVYSHFARTDAPSDQTHGRKQIAALELAISFLKKEGVEPKWRHIACSAPALLEPWTRFNLVRTGIVIYGLWPSEGTRKRFQKQGVFEPVLSWKALVAQVKHVPAKQRIGYDLTHRFLKSGKVAVIPIGYADGFDRIAQSGRGEVLIRGKRCPIAGRVCMNMFMVDVSHVSGVKAGDEVVLIGKQGRQSITAEHHAKLMGSNVYEVVARLNSLIQRVVH